MLERLEAWIEQAAVQLPVELFAFFGGLVEEVIAPIPSPLVMMAAGSAAAFQGRGYTFLLWLSLIGSVGKLLGSLLIYGCAMKAEDLFLQRFGKFVGVTRAQIDRLSARLNQGWKDVVILTALRALPFMPSSLLSVGCGILKISLRTFILSTFVGNLVRNLLFLYLGFAGKEAYQSLLAGLDSAESVAKVAGVLALAGIIGWIYWRRDKAPH